MYAKLKKSMFHIFLSIYAVSMTGCWENNSAEDSQANVDFATQCDNAEQGCQAELIQNVTVEKNKVCLGESFSVSVDSLQGSDIDISVNGKPGKFHYLQFQGLPGNRFISVNAATPTNYFDSRKSEIEVIDCGSDQLYPVVHYGPNPFNELTVDFQVTNKQDFVGQEVVYLWDFGVDKTVETKVPYVSFNYGDFLSNEEDYNQFQVELTVRRENVADASVSKTVVVHNIYALNKKRGVIQPRIENNTSLVRVNNEYEGNFIIENIENDPIEFSSRKIEYQQCDENSSTMQAIEEAFTLKIAANQSVNEKMTFPDSAITSSICGVAVHLQGLYKEGMETIASIYFDTPAYKTTHTQQLTDTNKIDLLNKIVEKGLVADPYNITDEQIYELEQSGLLEGLQNPTILKEESQRKEEPQVSEIFRKDDVLGSPCTPEDTPPRAGLTCQAKVGEWTVNPPRIANAKKGDIILSPGGCNGVIGQLLRHVSPPQKYGHTGIMTKDFYELRHSTASPDRYFDYLAGTKGSDGLQPEILKYGWPGTITQTVDAAFNGELLTDPENGKQYRLSGFSSSSNTCGEDVTATYPLVVKPHPRYEESVRPLLENVADLAQQINGHYRFFAYTDGAISKNSNFNAPQGTGWAEGTSATVCSSFIWHAIHDAGLQMEGNELETADIRLGAEIEGITPDGLYRYTATERKNAANWLHAYVHNKAFKRTLDVDIIGPILNPFIDAADDAADQTTNCFANDGCDKKDSNAWENPGVGYAVSPDDMLFWDSPTTGGVYGHNERLVYRSGENHQVTVWTPSEGTGIFSGEVLLDGLPVVDAKVTIAGIDLYTNANGNFTDSSVPSGTYGVQVTKTIGETQYQANETTVIINSGKETNIIIHLKSPDRIGAYEVKVEGNMSIRDSETFGIGGSTKKFPFDETITLSPEDISTREKQIVISHVVDGEVEGRVTLNLELSNDQSTIAVSGNVILRERDCFLSCGWDTNASEDISLTFFTKTLSSKQQNVSLEDDGDEVKVDFTITVYPTDPYHSAGKLEIPQTFTADMDEGVLGSTAPGVADIWFEAETETSRFITPLNGALLGVLGSTSTDSKIDECREANFLTTSRIPISSLSVGSYVCIRTNQARSSVLRLNSPVGDSPGTLNVTYTTVN